MYGIHLDSCVIYGKSHVIYGDRYVIYIHSHVINGDSIGTYMATCMIIVYSHGIYGDSRVMYGDSCVRYSYIFVLYGFSCVNNVNSVVSSRNSDVVYRDSPLVCWDILVIRGRNTKSSISESIYKRVHMLRIHHSFNLKSFNQHCFGALLKYIKDTIYMTRLNYHKVAPTGSRDTPAWLHPLYLGQMPLFLLICF